MRYDRPLLRRMRRRRGAIRAAPQARNGGSMTTTQPKRTAQLAALPVQPGEDPFVVANGGFYRRWFNLVDDIQPMIDTVAALKATEDEDWVPPWSAVAERYEREADAALARGDRGAARSG